MKHCLYIFGILLLSALAGCTTDISDESCPTIAIEDAIQINSPQFGDNNYFDSCRVVKLETNDSCLISEISSLEVYKEWIIISDRASLKVLLFNGNGEFIRQIGSVGRGPSEYLSISTFFVDQKRGRINIIDPMLQAIVSYDLDGTFRDKTRCDNRNIAYLREAFLTDDATLFCYSGTNWEENSIYSICDTVKFETKRVLQSYPVVTNGISYDMFTHSVCEYDGKTITLSLFDGYVYSYDGINYDKYLYIQNGKPITKKLDLLLNDNNGDYLAVRRELLSEKYNVGLNSIFENERFIVGDFFSTPSMKCFIYDKISKESVVIQDYLTYLPDFSLFQFSHDNSLIRIWDSSSIEFFLSNYEALDNATKARLSDIYDSVQGNYKPEEDNPVLIFYNLKNS
jgi:hypothetical protein